MSIHRRRLLGTGVLGWPNIERIGSRYGGIALYGETAIGAECAPVQFYEDVFSELVGKRARLTVVVGATRPSCHIGDIAIGLSPTMPMVDESVDLGVGTLARESRPQRTSSPLVVLRPDDERDVYWYDPRKLYRLHTQTVRLYVERASKSEPAWNVSEFVSLQAEAVVDTEP